MSPAGGLSLSRLWPPVLGWLLLALSLRLAAALWAGLNLPCSYDGCSYLRLAHALADGQGWLTEKGFLWPPGYPAFLALFVPGAEGNGAPLARLVQATLGSLLVLPVAALAARVAAPWPQRKKLALHGACAMVALDPTLIAYSHLLWPETMFLLLFTAAIALLCSAGGHPLRWLAAGLLLGAAGLTKAIGFWLVLPLALAVASGTPAQRLRAVGLALAGAMLVILPWTVRNLNTHDRFLLIDATAGTNLYLGNTDAPPVCWDWGEFDRWRVREARPRCSEEDFILRDRCESRAALQWIAAHPGAFARRAITKWADLVNPTSFLVRHVRAGRYRDVPMAGIPLAWSFLATAAAALPWMLLAVTATWGLALAPPGPVRRLTLALLVALLAIHALTFGMSRFRLPAVPLLAVFAALPLVLHRDGQALLPGGRRRRLGLALALGGLLWLWCLRLPALLNLSPFAGL